MRAASAISLIVPLALGCGPSEEHDSSPQLDAATDAGELPDAMIAQDGADQSSSIVDASRAAPIGWTRIETPLEDDGRTPLLTVPRSAHDHTAFALRTYVHGEAPTSAPCFQLEEVRADERVWIPAAASADYGDYCTRCEQRTAVGAGYGLFVLPSGAAGSAAPMQLELRVALRDCLTLTPLSRNAARPGKLVVESAWFSPPPRDQTVELPLTAVTATPYAWSQTGVDFEAVFARVQTIWQSAGIELRLRGPLSLSQRPSPLVFSTSDRASLASLDHEAKARMGAAGLSTTGPRVILTPCLLREDPLRLGRSEPLATTAHLPGGHAVASETDAIFVAAERCGGLSPGPRYLDSESLAVVIAHELGHYLGLFHAREPDGREDTLSDTSDEHPNLMRWQPSASATALSDTQIAIARRHAVLARE